MRKFESIQSLAAPLNESDVDTDAIFPARFLLLLNRVGLGKHLFQDLRRASASVDPFVLDQPKFASAKILIAGERFGIGSSREHAVWALDDAGIRCVIAKSFGDIFRQNCYKNGVLPIELDERNHAMVLAAAEGGQELKVDLRDKQITLAAGASIDFDIPEQKRQALLLGVDEITGILDEDSQKITEFEQRQRQTAPWLHLSIEQIEASRGAAVEHIQKDY